MIALISPAKIMTSSEEFNHDFKIKRTKPQEPRFSSESSYITSQMLQYSPHELADIYKCSDSIAKELYYRFIDFIDNPTSALAALYSYNGVVYKHIKQGKEFNNQDIEYLENHLRISSLLYGLLRPMDRIKPYRMEGYIELRDNHQRVDRYWRDIQTRTLIEDVEQSGGVLLYLASKEEQNAFHWREVKKQIRVIDFQFFQHKVDRLKQVIIYTKMARGEMVRYMMENRITEPELLKKFEWEGYRYNDSLSTNEKWVWVME